MPVQAVSDSTSEYVALPGNQKFQEGIWGKHLDKHCVVKSARACWSRDKEKLNHALTPQFGVAIGDLGTAVRTVPGSSGWQRASAVRYPGVLSRSRPGRGPLIQLALLNRTVKLLGPAG